MKRFWRVPVFILVLATGCSKPVKKPDQVRREDRDRIENELSNEVSLKQDRSSLDELRSEIPPEKQKTNDELAMFLELMQHSREQPALMRERFSSAVERKRSSFRQKVERLRSDFRNRETREREEFLSGLEKNRESFFRRRHSTSEIQTFSASQEKARSRFLSSERDRRQNFEAELNTTSKDFDSYMRERQNEFNEQLRLYSKRLSEQPKEKKAVTGDERKKQDSDAGKALGTEE